MPFAAHFGVYEFSVDGIATIYILIVAMTELVSGLLIPIRYLTLQQFIRINIVLFVAPVGISTVVVCGVAYAWLVGSVDTLTAGGWVGKVAIAVLTVVLLIAVFGLGKVVTREAKLWVRLILHKLISIRMQPNRWAEAMRAGSPREQARLLSLAEPENLGIGHEEILRLLAELHEHIRVDPALSAYQAKIAQMLEFRRQERAG